MFNVQVPSQIHVTVDLKLSDLLVPEGLLRRLARAIAPYLPPRRPGRFSLSVTAHGAGTAMRVTASLPAATASDVKTYELTYTTDGGAPAVLTSDGTPITFSAPVGSTVTATFVEIDAAGNRSDPSDPETLLVTDTIAPPKPGSFNLAVTADDAVPQPV